MPWNNCEGFGTSLEQNPQFMGRFSATSRRKGNRIIVISGAGDGNRTHVRSWGSLQSNSKGAGLAAFLRFSERLNWKIMENGKRPMHTTMNVYGKAMVPTQRRRSQQNSRRQNGPHHTVGHGPRRWPTKPSRPFHYLHPLLAGILDLETIVSYCKSNRLN